MTAHEQDVSALSHANQDATVAPPEIGIMLYDNPKECASGWASVNGIEATYVRQHSDLANNVTWITNGEFSQFITLGHRNVHNLRSLTFFRTQINQICADLGYEMMGAHARGAAQAVSEVATRVFRLAAQGYQWKAGELANADSLHENIKSRFPRDVYPNNPALERALRSAYQTDSALSRADFVPNSVFLTMRVNRLDHARQILACPIPDDAWEYIPNVKLPVAQRDRLAFCLKHDMPILAEVVLDMTRADSEYAALAAFGQRVQSRMVLREWVSHPELLWLARFTPLEIKSVFRSADYRTLPERTLLPATLTSDPLLHLSYSAGLLAENHWMALASDEYNKMLKKKSLTARAVWLRAADRALCFSVAKKAVDRGFTVTGYSTGAVRVRLLRSELMRAMEFAIENKITCPNFHRVIQEDDVLAANG
jgi:hypothetical protein